MALDAVAVLVVGVPVLLVPPQRGQRLTRVSERPHLPRQLLPQLHRAGRTHLHAAAAGNARGGVHLGRVGRAAHIGGVEQLGGAQRIAHVHIAVADGEDLVLPVDVGYLVHVAVLLRQEQDVQHLFQRDEVAFAGFHQVIGHVANGDAPVLGVATVIAAPHPLGNAAGTRAGGKPVILLQPMGDALHIGRLVVALDGPLHRNHVHANAGAARRHHLGHFGEGQKRHALEEGGNFGVLLNLRLVHHRELRRSRHEHGQHVALLVVGVLAVQVLPVVLEDALHR